MSSVGPAMSAPSRSSGVFQPPDSGRTQSLTPVLSISCQFTFESPSSRVRPGLVIGIAAAVGTGLPASAASARKRSTRFWNVLMVIRPGIQPSQYSTARRSEAIELPQYQIGMLPGPDGEG